MNDEDSTEQDAAWLEKHLQLVKDQLRQLRRLEKEADDFLRMTSR